MGLDIEILNVTSKTVRIGPYAIPSIWKIDPTDGDLYTIVTYITYEDLNQHGRLDLRNAIAAGAIIAATEAGD